MLYLEDYLEMIEHLPQELRDRFTEMRELDLAVQNNMDALEKRHNQIFNECRRSIVTTGEKPQNADEDFKEVLNEYFQVLEDADEKIQLANHVYDLVERYLRRLDTELHKFKCELEADNAGITELLEKRSLELDIPQPAQHSINSAAQAQKENRYRPRSEKRRDSSASAGHEKRIATGSTGLTVSSSLSAALSNTTDARHSTSASAVATQATSGNSLPSAANQSGVSYSLGHIGAGNAIAAAASQAIAATQQMQQGRRTASLKASYEAINTGVHGHELSIGRELAGAAHTALQAIQHDHANTKRQKKSVVNRKWTGQSSSNTSSVVNQIAAALPNVAAPSPPENVAAEIPADVDATFDAEWGSDPNEPRYCVCNQISYGDMVACDNEDCPFEWFHYPCVNITSPPKGKWYCPQCTSSMKRRGRKN